MKFRFCEKKIPTVFRVQIAVEGTSMPSCNAVTYVISGWLQSIPESYHCRINNNSVGSPLKGNETRSLSPYRKTMCSSLSHP